MPTTIIPLEVQYLDNKQNVQLILSVKIGRRMQRMVIDTGASHSCLSPHIVNENYKQQAVNIDDKVLSASENIEQPTLLYELPGIRIGDIYLRHYPFLMLDISHINAMLSSLHLPPVAGLIGSDLLQKYHAVIDYNSLTLTLNY